MAKVLIAEDTAFMRMVIKNILTDKGHEVVAEALDGEDCINKYEEFRPDIVFMDIVMPNMEGIDALKRIMEIDPDAKVIMCSSIGQQSVITEAIKLGAKDFIMKPFEVEKVLDVVDKVI